MNFRKILGLCCSVLICGSAYGEEPLNNIKSSYVGTFSAGPGRVLKILATNKSETRMKFELVVGAAKGKTSCQEGDANCVTIKGVASVFKTAYFQNEDSNCTFVLLPQGGSVEISLLSGGCAKGAANAGQVTDGNGNYVRKTGPRH